MKKDHAKNTSLQVSTSYILGVIVFSRLCFWGLAQIKGMPFLDSMCRWDCGWYNQIATYGYDLEPHHNFKQDAANWAFFPLFPILLAIAHKLTMLPYKIAGLLLTNLCMFFAIKLSLKYLRQTRPKVAEHFWVWFCTTGPYAFYFTNGYSEALFWFLGCAALVFWNQKKYFQAGALTALLCATRLFGLFWSIAYVTDLWKRRNEISLIKRLGNPSLVLGLCLSPLGLILFIFYLYFHMGDGLAFSHIQIAWGRSFDTAIPEWLLALKEWNDFSFLFSEIPKSRYSHAYFNLFIILGLILTIFCCTQKRILESTIACLSFLTALLAGVMSLPRFLVGTPIFAFALHDMVVRYFSKNVQAFLIGFFFLINLWLLNNWYDVAFFLV